MHPPRVTVGSPVSTAGSQGQEQDRSRTGVGQAASGDLQGLPGCSRVQALQEQGSCFQHTEQFLTLILWLTETGAHGLTHPRAELVPVFGISVTDSLWF